MSLLLAIFARMPRPLYWATLAHAALALACLAALLLPAAPVMGVHPALKPLKFAISIALFLASLGVLLPALSLAPGVRSGLAWLFAATMTAESLPIVVQALRGTTSHFNTRAPLDAAAWNLMFLAILVATLGMIYTTLVATFRPLTDGDSAVMHPLLALAWRAGLWLLLLSPVSGFAMGGRLQHSIGGADGGPGLPLVNWSILHGDLRVSHFFALHALQLFPLLAALLLLITVRPWLRWGVLSTVILFVTALCLGTLAQAFAGRPFLSLSSRRGAAIPAAPSDVPNPSAPR